MQAYLSSVSSFSDGGSVLVSIADGSCGEGSSDNPANDRDRGREHQRARTRFTLAGFRRIAGMQRSLPRRGAATHHVCPAWYPFRAPMSRRSGAGRQEFDLTGLSILATTTTNAFFSRALGKASRAQQPHKTRRLIRLLPPQPETRRLTHKLPPPPPGKPAGANGHTRRTASFHTPSGTCRPIGRPMAGQEVRRGVSTT